jgi:hemerythrin superfamily protein
MDAIAFLLKEHNKVRRTFAKIKKGSYREETKIKKFKDLCRELVVHETMEHKVWYPHFKNNPKVKNVVKHLLSEEKTAGKEIKSFKKFKPADWEKKFPKVFAKLKKAAEHHASNEETKLFPKVKKLLDKEVRKQIGKKMQSYKKQHLK